MTTDSERVRKWYDEHCDFEDKRLDVGRIERAITLASIHEIIQVVQQDKSARVKIADIGCGTGRYAIPLASEGHSVWISDLSPREVELANTKARGADITFAGSAAFDARTIRDHPEFFQKQFYDLSLFLGPFYHIMESQGRVDLMHAALDMTRSGGFVAAAFVTRNAHLRDIAERDPKRLGAESAFYRQYLSDGLYTRSSAAPMHHTTTTEIRSLLDKVNEQSHADGIAFELVKMVSCEGFLGFQHGVHLSDLSDGEFAGWLETLLQSASDPETRGCADHLLVILKRTA